MLVGVAKKLAGEFFTGVDDVLTGNRQVAPTPVDGTSVDQAPTRMPMVYRDSAVPARQVVARAGEPMSFILGAVFGAATALAGVLVGARVAQRSPR
jgi:hypothetical protein